MKIVCPNCEAPLNLPDDKVPVGRPFNFTCPKCKRKNSATVSPEEANESSAKAVPAGSNEPGSGGGLAREPGNTNPPEPLAAGEHSAPPLPPQPNPWQPDTVPSALGRGGAGSSFMDDVTETSKVVLLAVNEGPLNDNLLEQLEAMDYMITISYGMRDALRQLKLSSFDLVVIGDDFDDAQGDNHPLIKALQLMEMDIRRRMYVVLIGSEYRTLDGFTAYALSVNAVINDKDIEQFEKALISGQVHQKRFYQPFLNLLDKKSLV